MVLRTDTGITGEQWNEADGAPIEAAEFLFTLKAVRDGQESWQKHTRLLQRTAPASYYDLVMGMAGLVAYWRLGESSGPTAADEKATYPMTYMGTPTFSQPGVLIDNTTVSLDGNGDYVALSAADFRGSDTQGAVVVWFKLSNPITAGYQALFTSSDEDSTANRCGLFIDNDSVFWHCRPTGGTAFTVDAVGDYDDGQWHLAVAQCDGVKTELYLDGALAAQGGDVTTGFWFSSLVGRDNVLIGAMQRSDGLGREMNGLPDEAAVFNRPLSPTEIALLYVNV